MLFNLFRETIIFIFDFIPDLYTQNNRQINKSEGNTNCNLVVITTRKLLKWSFQVAKIRSVDDYAKVHSVADKHQANVSKLGTE